MYKMQEMYSNGPWSLTPSGKCKTSPAVIEHYGKCMSMSDICSQYQDLKGIAINSQN